MVCIFLELEVLCTYSVVSKNEHYSHVIIIWTTNELICIILCTLYIPVSVHIMLSLIWVKINSFNEQRPLYSHYCLPWVMATFHYTPKSDFNLWQLPAVHRRRQPKQKFLHTQICHLPEVTTEANSYECGFCSLLTLVSSIFNVKRTYSEDKWRKVNIPKMHIFFSWVKFLLERTTNSLTC